MRTSGQGPGAGHDVRGYVPRSGPEAAYALLVGVLAVLMVIRAMRVPVRREFGAEWDVYAGRTWRLLPFVY